MVRAYLALSASETMAFMSLSIRLCHWPGTSRADGPDVCPPVQVGYDPDAT